MAELKEYLCGLKWTDQDFENLGQKIRNFKLDDPVLQEVFLDAGFMPNTQHKPVDPTYPIPRFRQNPRSSHVDAIESAANQAAHPFLAAILLDYAALATPPSKRWRDLGFKAANRYADAVNEFTQGCIQNHIIGLSDAVIRSRFWALKTGHSVDTLLDALIRAVPQIGQKGIGELVGSLAQSIASDDIQSNSGSTGKFENLYNEMKSTIENINERNSKAVAAIALKELGKLAKQSKNYQEWASNIVVDAALARANTVSPLVAAAELHFAAQMARDTGNSRLSDVVQKINEINPELQGSGTDIRSAEMRIKIKDIDSDAANIRNGPTTNERMNTLAALPLLPTSEEIETYRDSFLKSNSILMLVNCVVIGQHGPTGESPEEFAAHCSIETFILFRALISSEILKKADRSMCFSSEVVATLIDINLLGKNQSEIYTSVWNLWCTGDKTALFGLFPMLEQVLRNGCNQVGHNSTTMHRNNLGVKHGSSLTELVKNAFGADLSNVIEHLMGEHGSLRHSFAHGYVRDDDANEILADYVAYLISWVYRFILLFNSGEIDGS